MMAGKDNGTSVPKEAGRELYRRNRLVVALFCIALAVSVSCGLTGCSSNDALQTTETSLSSSSSASEETSSSSPSSADTEGSTEGEAAPVPASGTVSDEGEAPAQETAETAAGQGGSPDVESSTSTTGTSSSDSGGTRASYVHVNCSVSSNAADGSVKGSISTSLPAGSTAVDALAATGLSYQARSSQYGTYIAAIGGLAEKDKRYGSSSGWLYSVNGTTPGYSAGSYVLKDGDNVSWYFTK